MCTGEPYFFIRVPRKLNVKLFLRFGLEGTYLIRNVNSSPGLCICDKEVAFYV
jgi:hypothetical protein